MTKPKPQPKAFRVSGPGKYRTRVGDTVDVTKVLPTSEYIYRVWSKYRSWTIDGYLFHGEKNIGDLVAKIEPTKRKPTAKRKGRTQRMEWCIVKPCSSLASAKALNKYCCDGSYVKQLPVQRGHK